ncbi:MAG: hypothetical protein ACR2ML_03470 [Solirubrobacteraceae bacterium]
MRRLTVAFALLALTVVAGCESTSTEKEEPATFKPTSDLPMTFTYPGNLKRPESSEFSVKEGSESKADVVLAIDEKNAVVVSRYDIGVAIDRGNLAQVRPELDGIVKRLTRKRARGTRVKRGGLPGFEYRVPIVKPVKARSVLTFLFDGRREYEFNCQYTSEHEEELLRACDQVLKTLKVTRAGG